MDLAHIIQYKEQGLSYFEVLDKISTEGWSERDFRKKPNYTAECIELINKVYLKERIIDWFELFNGDFTKLSKKFELSINDLQEVCSVV